MADDLALKLMMRHEAEVVVQVALALEELHAAAVVAQPVLFVDAH